MMFKMYHVVWKRRIYPPGLNFTRPAFKMYHVVWKRGWKDVSFFPLKEFKMYHVVWKQFRLKYTVLMIY